MASGEIRIEKVGGKNNLADALTKHVDAKSLSVHIEGCLMETRLGRHHDAPRTVGEEVIEKIQWDEE